METSTKKISHKTLRLETQFKIEFLPPFTGGQKYLDFPVLFIFVCIYIVAF